MDKLIIIATVDSAASYPRNIHCPPAHDVDRIVEEYVLSFESGASIAHLHGVYSYEEQADGRTLPRIDDDGWQRLTENLRKVGNPILEFGLGSIPMEERIRLLDLEPDTMSVCFNPEDLHFHPDPRDEPRDFYTMRTRDDLCRYAELAKAHNVKLDIECFHTGAYFNIGYVADRGLLPTPIMATLLLGWRGGGWTPATPQGLIFMVDNIPSDTIWLVSVMDPERQWGILSQAIAMGGHVRVGWEDNPFLSRGTYATRCHQLVDKIVGIAHDLGREVATIEEAREILFRDIRASAQTA